MEPTQQQEQVVASPATPSSTGIFGTKIPATAAFLVAILLFLLPFGEVRCNGSAMANNTGVGIAMGSEWKEVVTKNIFGESLNTNDSKKEFNRKINLFIGLLAAASLIAMLIDLKSKVKSDTSVKSSDLNLNMGMKITVDGTGWFYFALILFLAAALFSWQRSKLKAG